MTTQSKTRYAALILRLALGSMYLAHGLTKLFIFTPAGTAGFFSSLGLPGFLGPLTMALEIAGGIALLIGLHSRWVAAALSPILIGAIAFVHATNGWSFANQGGGWEYPLFLLLASFAQVLLGDGAYAASQHRFGSRTSVATA